MKNNVTKDQWIEMYEEIGLNANKRMEWHRLFEGRYPQGHQAFLEWLGIPPKEIDEIRAECR